MTLFYCAHWQAYVTGTLKMGRIDVTEAQYSIIFIHILSATLGSDFWGTQVMLSISSSRCSYRNIEAGKRSGQKYSNAMVM